jgi:hypothetical protein
MLDYTGRHAPTSPGYCRPERRNCSAKRNSSQLKDLYPSDISRDRGPSTAFSLRMTVGDDERMIRLHSG